MKTGKLKTGKLKTGKLILNPNSAFRLIGMHTTKEAISLHLWAKLGVKLIKFSFWIQSKRLLRR